MPEIFPALAVVGFTIHPGDIKIDRVRRGQDVGNRVEQGVNAFAPFEPSHKKNSLSRWRRHRLGRRCRRNIQAERDERFLVPHTKFVVNQLQKGGCTPRDKIGVAD